MPIEVAHWESLPVTERAISKYLTLHSLWQKVGKVERELAVLLTDPEIDLAAYYKGTRGVDHE